MKKCIIKGKAFNGKEIEWECQETKSNSGYGRDIYVNVTEKMDGKFNNNWCWDCRYDKDYDFFDVVILNFREITNSFTIEEILEKGD